MFALECVSLQTAKATKISEANVICLGNFDGVHAAHRALLRQAVSLRDTRFSIALCGVFCFREPSSDFLSSDPPRHLCTLDQKLERFANEGLDFAVLADFKPLQALSPRSFAQDVLKRDCACVAAVCGYNYRFGQYGSGTAQNLEAFLNAPVLVQDAVCDGGAPISSTRIRALLSQGNVKEAARLLTLPYAVTATVVHGKQLGRRIGAPTVNQCFPDKMQIPRHGVYLTQVHINGAVYKGITNVGVHPTVDDTPVPNCETHLLDFNGDLYDQSMTVEFLDFIRPERQFDSVEALQQQIQADIATARALS